MDVSVALFYCVKTRAKTFEVSCCYIIGMKHGLKQKQTKNQPQSKNIVARLG